MAPEPEVPGREAIQGRLDALEPLVQALQDESESHEERREAWEASIEAKFDELREEGADRDRRSSLSSAASKEDPVEQEGLNELKSNLSSRLREAVKLMEALPPDAD